MDSKRGLWVRRAPVHNVNSSNTTNRSRAEVKTKVWHISPNSDYEILDSDQLPSVLLQSPRSAEVSLTLPCVWYIQLSGIFQIF